MFLQNQVLAIPTEKVNEMEQVIFVDYLPEAEKNSFTDCIVKMQHGVRRVNSKELHNILKFQR